LPLDHFSVNAITGADVPRTVIIGRQGNNLSAFTEIFQNNAIPMMGKNLPNTGTALSRLYPYCKPYASHNRFSPESRIRGQGVGGIRDGGDMVECGMALKQGLPGNRFSLGCRSFRDTKLHYSHRRIIYHHVPEILAFSVVVLISAPF
jgi:hypothetical protein